MYRIPRLHLISDRRLCPLDRFFEVARLAALSGVDAVHIRERDLPDAEITDLARLLVPGLNELGCLLLINDRIDVAALSGADGVHLPERGASPERARQILPRSSLIGVSVHSPDAAIEAEQRGANYVIAGHVFKTGSKPGLPGRGLSFVRDVTDAVDIPVIAIGGVTSENAREVIEAGAHGVAVISAILEADDPSEAARRIRSVIEDVEVRSK